MNSTNALFIVGLMIAIAIEHSGLHLRVALGFMLLVNIQILLLLLFE